MSGYGYSLDGLRRGLKNPFPGDFGPAESLEKLAKASRFGLDIGPGFYVLHETLVLGRGCVLDLRRGAEIRVAHSGIGIVLNGEGSAILGGTVSGAVPLSGYEKDGNFVFPRPEGCSRRSFFKDGEVVPLAMWPVDHWMGFQGSTTNYLNTVTGYTVDDFPEWHQGMLLAKRCQGGNWTFYSYALTESFMENIPNYGYNSVRFWNCRGGLLEGTFYYDEESDSFVYMPFSGESLERCVFSSASPYCLVGIDGQTGSAREDVVLDGVTLEASAYDWNYLDTADGAEVGQEDKAAVYALGASFEARGVEIKNAGMHGMVLGTGCFSCIVSGCTISGTAGAGVNIGDHDRDGSAPGTAEGISMTGCVVEDVGRQALSAAAVRIGRVRDVDFSGNTVRRGNYSGLFLDGELWVHAARGNLVVRFNEIHDFMGVIGDGAGIYASGEYDDGGVSVIADNYIHDIHAFRKFYEWERLTSALYLDMGSKGFLMSGNLLERLGSGICVMNNDARCWHIDNKWVPHPEVGDQQHYMGRFGANGLFPDYYRYVTDSPETYRTLLEDPVVTNDGDVFEFRVEVDSLTMRTDSDHGPYEIFNLSESRDGDGNLLKAYVHLNPDDVLPYDYMAMRDWHSGPGGGFLIFDHADGGPLGASDAVWPIQYCFTEEAAGKLTKLQVSEEVVTYGAVKPPQESAWSQAAVGQKVWIMGVPWDYRNFYLKMVDGGGAGKAFKTIDATYEGYDPGTGKMIMRFRCVRNGRKVSSLNYGIGGAGKGGMISFDLEDDDRNYVDADTVEGVSAGDTITVQEIYIDGATKLDSSEMELEVAAWRKRREEFLAGSEAVGGFPVTTGAADLIESAAASGEVLPSRVYETDRTVVLPENSRLRLAPGAEIRIGHSGVGIDVSESGVIIEGGEITGRMFLREWSDEGGGIVSVPVFSENKVRSFRIVGEEMPRSRYPESGFITGVTDADPDDPENPHVFMNALFDDPVLAAALPANPQDIEWFARYNFLEWGTTLQSMSVESGDTVRVKFGAYMNYGTNKFPTTGSNWLENAPEFLTPGTWCHDRANGRILYMFRQNETVDGLVAEVDSTGILVRVAGTEEAPVNGFMLDRVRLSASSYRLPDTVRIRDSEIPSETAALAVLGYCGNVVLRNLSVSDVSHVGAALFTEKSFGRNRLVSSVFSRMGSTGIRIGNWARGDENQHENPDRPGLDLKNVLVEDADTAPGGGGSGIRVHSLENSEWSNVKVRRSGYMGLIVGGAAEAVNSCKGNTFRGLEVSEWMLRLNDGGGVYMAGVQRETLILDSMFRDADGPKNTGAVYFENNSCGITARNILVPRPGDGNYHFKTNIRSRECRFEGARLGLPLKNGATGYTDLYSAAPEGDAAWYEAHHKDWMKFTADSVVDNNDGTATVVYSDKADVAEDRAWPVAWPADDHIDPSDNPIGCWIMPTTGSQAWKWFGIVGKSETSLDVAVQGEDGGDATAIGAGDRIMVMWAYEKDTVLLDPEEAEAEEAAWLRAHPDPFVLPSFSGSVPGSTKNAAALLEFHAANGIPLPEGVYETERTVGLGEGASLLLHKDAVIRIGHDGTGIEVTGSGVSIHGGTIDGGELLTDWEDLGDGTWACPVERSEKIREMFVGGERRFVSRYPETGFLQVRSGYETPFVEVVNPDGTVSNHLFEMEFSDAALAGNIPAVPGDVELRYYQDWYASGGTCDSISDEGGGVVKCVTKGNYYSGYHDPAGTPYPSYFWLNNAPEFLTPGTWCHDRQNGRIIYKPLVGETLGGFSSAIPRASRLLDIYGDKLAKTYVSGVVVKHVQFRHCAVRIPDEDKILYSSGKGNAALQARTYVSDLNVEHCSFEHLGGWALLFGYLYTSGGGMRNCRFSDLASQGIQIGEAWRANDWYLDANGVLVGNYNDYAEWDIEDCVFEDIGVLQPQARAIMFNAWRNSTMSGCKIRRCPYIAVTVGGATSVKNGCLDNEIRNNEFGYCMQKLRDGGFIYLTGSQSGNTIHGNLFHHSEQDDIGCVFIYHEAGSVGYRSYGNLCYAAAKYHMMTSQYTRGVEIDHNKVEGPLLDDVIAMPQYQNYGPGKGSEWYDAEHAEIYSYTLEADPANNDDGTKTLSFPEKVLRVNSVGTLWEQRPPEGWWVLFLAGASAGRWFRISTRDETTLVVDGTDYTGVHSLDAASGDKCVAIAAYTHDNEILDPEGLALELAAWESENPEPVTGPIWEVETVKVRKAAAGYLEYCASNRRKVPAGVYETERTVELNSGDALILDDGAEIRIGHSGDGILISGSEASISGGAVSGLRSVSFVDGGDGNWYGDLSGLPDDAFDSGKWKWSFLLKNRKWVPWSKWPTDGTRHALTGSWGNVVAYENSDMPAFNQGMVYQRVNASAPWRDEGGEVVDSDHMEELRTYSPDSGSPMVFNNVAETLQPGEFWYDVAGNRLVYKPIPGEGLPGCEFEIASAENTIVVSGEEGAPLEDVSISDCVISGGGWRPFGQWGLDSQAGFEDGPAVVRIDRASVFLERCRIEFSGSFGVLLYREVDGCLVHRCLVGDCASSCLQAGDPAYSQVTYGTRVSDGVISENVSLLNNVFRNPGRRYWGSLAVNCQATVVPVVSGNDASGGGWATVQIRDCPGFTMTDNEVHDPESLLADCGCVYLGFGYGGGGGYFARNLIHGVKPSHTTWFFVLWYNACLYTDLRLQDVEFDSNVYFTEEDGQAAVNLGIINRCYHHDEVFWSNRIGDTVSNLENHCCTHAEDAAFLYPAPTDKYGNRIENRRVLSRNAVDNENGTATITVGTDNFALFRSADLADSVIASTEKDGSVRTIVFEPVDSSDPGYSGWDRMDDASGDYMDRGGVTRCRVIVQDGPAKGASWPVVADYGKYGVRFKLDIDTGGDDSLFDQLAAGNTAKIMLCGENWLGSIEVWYLVVDDGDKAGQAYEVIGFEVLNESEVAYTVRIPGVYGPSDVGGLVSENRVFLAENWISRENEILGEAEKEVVETAWRRGHPDPESGPGARFSVVKAAAAYLEHCAKFGKTIPSGVYETERTVVLGEGSSLLLDDEAEIRVSHPGVGLRINGSNVIVAGGAVSGTMDLTFTDAGDGTWTCRFPDWAVRYLSKNDEALNLSYWPHSGYVSKNPPREWNDVSEYAPEDGPGWTPSVMWRWTIGTELNYLWGDQFEKLPDQAAYDAVFEDGSRSQIVNFRNPDMMPPGSFAYDEEAGEIVYKPLPDEDILSCRFKTGRAGFLPVGHPDNPEDYDVCRLVHVRSEDGSYIDNVVLQGVTFDGCRFDWDLIEHNTSGVGHYGGVYKDAFMVRFYKTTDSEVKNCVFRNSQCKSLGCLDGTSRFTIENNLFVGSASTPIQMVPLDYHYWRHEYNRIAGNTVKESGFPSKGNYGIYAGSFWNSSIEENVVEKSGLSGIKFGFYAGWHDLDTRRFRGCRVTGNRVSGCCSCAFDYSPIISLGALEGIVYEDNLCENAARFVDPVDYYQAMFYMATGRAVVRNNLFVDEDAGNFAISNIKNGLNLYEGNKWCGNFDGPNRQNDRTEWFSASNPMHHRSLVADAVDHENGTASVWIAPDSHSYYLAKNDPFVVQTVDAASGTFTTPHLFGASDVGAERELYGMNLYAIVVSGASKGSWFPVKMGLVQDPGGNDTWTVDMGGKEAEFAAIANPDEIHIMLIPWGRSDVLPSWGLTVIDGERAGSMYEIVGVEVEDETKVRLDLSVQSGFWGPFVIPDSSVSGLLSGDTVTFVHNFEKEGNERVDPSFMRFLVESWESRHSALGGLVSPEVEKNRVKVTTQSGEVTVYESVTEVDDIINNLEGYERLDFSPGVYNYGGYPRSLRSTLPDGIEFHSEVKQEAVLKFVQKYPRGDLHTSIEGATHLMFRGGANHVFDGMVIDLNAQENVPKWHSEVWDPNGRGPGFGAVKVLPRDYVAPGADIYATRYTATNGDYIIRYGFQIAGGNTTIRDCRFTNYTMGSAFWNWRINRYNDASAPSGYKDVWSAYMRESFPFWFWGSNNLLEDNVWGDPFAVDNCGVYCTLIMLGTDGGYDAANVFQRSRISCPGPDWWWSDRRISGTDEQTDGVNREWTAGFSVPSSMAISWHSWGTTIQDNYVENFKYALHHDTYRMNDITILRNKARNVLIGMNWGTAGGAGASGENGGENYVIRNNDFEISYSEYGTAGRGFQFTSSWPVKNVDVSQNKVSGDGYLYSYSDYCGLRDNVEFHDNIDETTLGPHYGIPDYVVSSESGDFSLDAASTRFWDVTLTGPATLTDILNPDSAITSAYGCAAWIRQDATGGRTLALDPDRFSIIGGDIGDVATLGLGERVVLRFYRTTTDGKIRTWITVVPEEYPEI